MNINNIDMRQLRYFIAVAEELNFSRAAERLNISQPPLSVQIKSLEEQLSVTLLKRTKRKVELTEAGTHLLQAAQDLLGDLQQTLLSTQEVARGQEGEIKIGTNFSSIFYPRFSDMLARYHAAYPNIKISIKEMLSQDAVLALNNRQIDIGFLWPETAYMRGDVEFQEIERVPLELCVSAKNPLVKKKSITIEDLRDQRLLFSARQLRSDFVENLQNKASKKGFELQLYQETAIFPVLVHLVAAGYGLAFLPRFLEVISPGRVKFIPVDGLKVKGSKPALAFAYNKKSITTKAQHFLATVG